MPSSKSRNWSQEEDQALENFMNHRLKQEKFTKCTWNEIAQQIASKFQNQASTQQSNTLRNLKFTKSGKQCRQRWMNHLNHGLNKNSKWTIQENRILFESHNELGNKWSTIAHRLEGRTDNCVKNHFYSVLRRGMRKINQYIEEVKRKETLVKTFKNQMLNKILLLSESEGKYDQKFHFKNRAKELAVEIKQLLIRLSGEDWDDKIENAQNQMNQEKFEKISSETLKLQQHGYQMINQFAKNCKKKKSKKANDEDEDDFSDSFRIGKLSKKEIKNLKKKNQETGAKKLERKVKKEQSEKEEWSEGEEVDLNRDQQSAKNLYLEINSPSSLKCMKYDDFWPSNNRSQANNSIKSNKNEQKGKLQKIQQFKIESISPNTILNNKKGRHTLSSMSDQAAENDADKSYKQPCHEMQIENGELKNSIKINNKPKSKVAVKKSNSLEQSQFGDHNDIANIFVNNHNSGGIYDFRDQWFRGSGTDLDKNFNNMLGGTIPFQGNNSYTDLFGKKDNQMYDFEYRQKYTPECIDFMNNNNFQNSAISPYPHKNSQSLNLNDSQDIDKNIKLNMADSSYFNFGYRSGQSINFSPMINTPQTPQNKQKFNKQFQSFMESMQLSNQHSSNIDHLKF